MKQCSKCRINKKISDFYKRKTGLRKGEFYEKCKDCYKNRGRNYYHLNRDRQLKLALIRKEKYKRERKILVEKIKKNKPCMDCGKIYPPWVMDFDHRDGEVKISSISYMITGNTSNIEKIKVEIAKCDLVCANCHRQRTYSRLLKI